MANIFNVIQQTLKLFQTLKEGLLPQHFISTLQNKKQQLMSNPLFILSQQLNPLYSSNDKQDSLTPNHEQIIFSFQLDERDLSISKPRQVKQYLNNNLNDNDKEIIQLSTFLFNQLQEFSLEVEENQLLKGAKQHKTTQLLNLEHTLKQIKNILKGQESKSTSRNNPEKLNNVRKRKGVKNSSETSRSLLTEKLKNLPAKAEEGEFQFVGDRVIVKSSWIMKQMKRKCSNEFRTQPLISMSNQSDFLERNFKSYQPEILPQIQYTSEKHFSSRKSICNKMISRPSEPKNPEKKSKGDSMGCARCDIY